LSEGASEVAGALDHDGARRVVARRIVEHLEPGIRDAAIIKHADAMTRLSMVRTPG